MIGIVELCLNNYVPFSFCRVNHNKKVTREIYHQNAHGYNISQGLKLSPAGVNMRV